MTSITGQQHTALLAALDALAEKHAAATARRDLQSTWYLFKQYDVIRDLLNTAVTYTAEAEAAL